MPEFYQVTIKASDYPTLPKIYKAESGTTIFIRVRDNETFSYKFGDDYKDYPALVDRIIYSPKKWWQFWEKKKVIGVILKIK